MDLDNFRILIRYKYETGMTETGRDNTPRRERKDIHAGINEEKILELCVEYFIRLGK